MEKNRSLLFSFEEEESLNVKLIFNAEPKILVFSFFLLSKKEAIALIHADKLKNSSVLRKVDQRIPKVEKSA
jgi:hypothetical protein